jgi:hypothetical protein
MGGGRSLSRSTERFSESFLPSVPPELARTGVSALQHVFRCPQAKTNFLRNSMQRWQPSRLEEEMVESSWSEAQSKTEATSY